MFNADLALSVTMTAISTLLSIFMLPANLLLYSRFSYDDDVIEALDWMSLFTALVVVIGAITLGLFFSAKLHSNKFNVVANKVSDCKGNAKDDSLQLLKTKLIIIFQDGKFRWNCTCNLLSNYVKHRRAR